MMAEQQRRLAAIVAMDVAGYSRLMGRDERDTLNRLTEHREVIDPIGLEHGGRIVGTAGDGVLVEFPSVVEAVNFSLRCQAVMAERNTDIPDDEKMLFRIGINLGDVLVQDDDLFGDGVNVAARIEALAEPGGIWVSRTVRDSVRDKLEIQLEDQGEVEVKNIARPVRVFRLSANSDAVAAIRPVGVVSSRTVNAKSGNWKSIAAVAALVSILILAGGGYWGWHTNIYAALQTQKPEHRLSNKPSIAVLPFDNMSGDPEQEYFASGMADDLITDLSKLSGLYVIARNSSFSYQDQNIDIRAIGQDLGVAFVLDGSVRRDGDNVRINAQLVDVESGEHVWAERFDGELINIFTLQDRITSSITQSLSVALGQKDDAGAGSAPTNNLQAYDFFLRGRAAYFRMDGDSLRESLQYYTWATEDDPGFINAYSGLARAAWQLHALQHSLPEPATATPIEIAEKAVSKVLTLDPENGLGNAVQAAIIQQTTSDHSKAVTLARKATTLEPGNVDVRILAAYLYARAGLSKEALEEIAIVRSLSPRPSPGEAFFIGLVLLYAQEPTQAIVFLEIARNEFTEKWWAHANLAAAYSLVGRTADAKLEIDSYMKVPGFAGANVEAVAMAIQHFADDVRERFLDALKQAGLPQWPFGFKPKPGDKLSASDIRRLVFGHTRIGQNSAGAYEIDIAEDGSAKLRRHGQVHVGKYWLNNDILCNQYQAFSAGRPQCGFVFRNPEGRFEDRNEFAYVQPLELSWFSMR